MAVATIQVQARKEEKEEEWEMLGQRYVDPEDTTPYTLPANIRARPLPPQAAMLPPSANHTQAHGAAPLESSHQANRQRSMSQQYPSHGLGAAFASVPAVLPPVTGTAHRFVRQERLEREHALQLVVEEERRKKAVEADVLRRKKHNVRRREDFYYDRVLTIEMIQHYKLKSAQRERWLIQQANSNNLSASDTTSQDAERATGANEEQEQKEPDTEEKKEKKGVEQLHRASNAGNEPTMVSDTRIVQEPPWAANIGENPSGQSRIRVYVSETPMAVTPDEAHSKTSDVRRSLESVHTGSVTGALIEVHFEKLNLNARAPSQ